MEPYKSITLSLVKGAFAVVAVIALIMTASTGFEAGSTWALIIILAVCSLGCGMVSFLQRLMLQHKSVEKPE